MLSSKKNSHTEEKQKSSTEVLTFLGVGTEFIGKIVFNGTLRVDGYIEGEIEGNDTLILGEEGTIKGVCRVARVIISGKYTGEIFAKEKINLKNNAHVEGTISAPAIVIEEGARFNGNCTMSKDSGVREFDSGQSDFATLKKI